MDQLYAYPLLRLEDDDPPPEKLHKILTVFRELWNTKNTHNFDLPVGELDGCRFGLQAMQDLLNQPGCDSFTNFASKEINHKIFIAMRSPDASKLMAEFMRWATDSYMDFLAAHIRFTDNTARLGLLKVDRAMNRLLANTSEVDRFIQLNDLERDNNFCFARMLELLARLFNAIVDHHRKVPNSRTGAQEILLVAEEADFIIRRTNNYVTLYSMFAMHEGHETPLSLSLEGITLAIMKQIK